MRSVFSSVVSRVRVGVRIAAVVVLLSAAMYALAQDGTALRQAGAIPTLPAKVLIGLPEVAPNTDGSLSFGERTLHFTTAHGATVVSTDIPKSRILAVSDGNERIETGGTGGRIARAVIPYGGGLVLGTVTHKKVGLLTIEYLDAKGEFHGAVFSLRPEDIAGAMAGLDLQHGKTAAPQVRAEGACDAKGSESDTVRVEMVDADAASGFPAEDRVMLYEHLLEQLAAEKSVVTVYRAGDGSAAARCAEFTVRVRATGFDKGDQAVRASVGPLGHFVGTTKVRFELRIARQDGSPIFDEIIQKKEGSDSDSLNVTKVISKTVVKSLKRSRKEYRTAA